MIKLAYHTNKKPTEREEIEVLRNFALYRSDKYSSCRRGPCPRVRRSAGNYSDAGEQTDNQEKTITMLLSYLGHSGSGGNSSAYDEHIPNDVDVNKLIRKNGTYESMYSVIPYN